LRFTRVEEEVDGGVDRVRRYPCCRRQTRVAAQAFGQRGDFVEEFFVVMNGEECVNLRWRRWPLGPKEVQPHCTVMGLSVGVYLLSTSPSTTRRASMPQS
ncbi:MAG: hypothetical protein JWM74_6333, partial [Myxococcaceae bacterium]|nr:hypothetical protein [Myxococcaceae bacterium]